MKKRIDYLALFGGTEPPPLDHLQRELSDVMAVHPAPRPYRERLRGQLVAAARAKRFDRRETRDRIVLAMGVVVTVLVSVVGLIAWRALGERAQSS
ncbi:MAG: hypothetical protein HZB53_18690 [Chloroflexi bacterium]|nr:hypothetical protein [Chloroflexota bacterium]